jgi:hypothetical protein
MAAAERSEGKVSGRAVTTTKSSLRTILVFWFIISLIMFLFTHYQYFAQRFYLKGFVEAIIPLDGSSSDRIEAILHYFRNHPSRLKGISERDRTPASSLRFEKSMRDCGSATNAFVHLALSAGIPARGLLLLNERGITQHVVAEVWLNGRWVVVDPIFGLAMKDENGRWLTREDLRDPKILRRATRHIDYPPNYTYDRTSYINWRKVPLIGQRLGDWLRKLGWEERLGRPLVLDNAVLARLYLWFFSATLSGSLLFLCSIRKRREGKGA